MSGSPLILQHRASGSVFLGILSQFVPFTSRSVFIKASTIKQFIRGNLSFERNENYYNKNGNNHLNNSGGNAHALGGDGFFVKKRGEKYIHNFYEPREGVVLENGRRLLAVAGNQVDGWDDYYWLKEKLPQDSFEEQRVYSGQQNTAENFHEMIRLILNNKPFMRYSQSIFSESSAVDDSILNSRKYFFERTNIKKLSDTKFSFDLPYVAKFTIEFLSNEINVTDEEGTKLTCDLSQFKKYECFDVQGVKYFSISSGNYQNDEMQNLINIRYAKLIGYEQVEFTKVEM